MRNQYPAQCYICHTLVKKKDGFIERSGKDSWQVRHVGCESQHYLKLKAEKKSYPNNKQDDKKTKTT